MKKSICFILILSLALTYIYAGSRRDKGITGKIVIYTSMYTEAIESIQRELRKQFPKCGIEFISRGTGIIQGLVAAEQASGRLGCDILMVSEPSYSLELKNKGMLHSFKSAEASNLAFNYDPDGFWYPVRVSVMVMAYNPEKYSPDTLPSSFHDFGLDTGVQGAISMRNPLVSGTTLATVATLRDKYGYGYFDDLGKQGVMIDYGSAETLRRLETGECKVVMVLEESILSKREKESSVLEVIYPSDGAVVIPSTIMIINNQWNSSKNIPAAEAITEWFLGQAGQNAIVDSWMHSVRADFDRLPYDARSTYEIMVNSMPVNWEQIYHTRKEILNNFEERVSSKR